MVGTTISPLGGVPASGGVPVSGGVVSVGVSVSVLSAVLPPPEPPQAVKVIVMSTRSVFLYIY